MQPAFAEKTWICPTAEDRARLLDMEQRLKPVRVLSFVFLGVGFAASIPWLGLWPIPLSVAALLGFVGIDHSLGRARRPEYFVAGAWVLSVSMIFAGCLLTGSVKNVVMLGGFTIPAVTLPARFRRNVVVLGVALIFVAILVLTFGVNPAGTLRFPVPAFVAMAIVASVVTFTMALMQSDLHHRTEAFIDPLTGMLNRHALHGRIAELAAQAAVTQQPIALILADLDHFKAINDEHGHDTGDAVLRQAAYRMRAELRAYDLAYRLGGEEFLVVMPGADAHRAEEVADALRTAIAGQSIGGVDVTMSVGVSASSARDFDYTRLFAQADKALYAAKQSGRNRVSVVVEDDHGCAGWSETVGGRHDAPLAPRERVG